MVELGCLACSKIIKVPQYIDTEKYDGQVVCEECNSLLYIKLVKGKVEKYKLIENKRETDIKLNFHPAEDKGEKDSNTG
jgi:DNA-directed RNA polymerase subunit RPC12/RpoP